MFRCIILLNINIISSQFIITSHDIQSVFIYHHLQSYYTYIIHAEESSEGFLLCFKSIVQVSLSVFSVELYFHFKYNLIHNYIRNVVLCYLYLSKSHSKIYLSTRKYYV